MTFDHRYYRPVTYDGLWLKRDDHDQSAICGHVCGIEQSNILLAVMAMTAVIVIF